MANITINGVTYTTAKALKAEAQKRVQAMRLSHQVTRWWPEKDPFWNVVIGLHPRLDEKIVLLGGETNFLGFGLTLLGKDPQMGVLGKDGAFVSFGWNECVKAPFRRRLKTDAISLFLAKAKRGMRRAIVDQVAAVKDAAIEADGFITCEESHARVLPNGIHVDHDPTPFDDIANVYLEAIIKRDHREPDLVETHAADPLNNQFADPVIRQDWIDYHRAVATYRLVTEEVNLAKGRGP
ncbi:MAG: hypothetical protein SWI22_01185 [Pseudomonadota bacterium]|nr:hypothetical protein [Pseudomonadota bacterium]